MFTQPVQSSTTLSPNVTPASPTPPSRSTRLRGLNYLRSYTHNHSASSSQSQQPSSPPPDPLTQRNTLVRSISYQPSTPPADEHASPRPISAMFVNGDRNSGLKSMESPPPSAETAAGHSSVNAALGGISRVLARHRSGSAPHGVSRASELLSPSGTALPSLPQEQMPTIRFTSHQDLRSTRPSLAFPPTSRTLPNEDDIISVGRYSERDIIPNPPANAPSSAPVGFKSKVVSRKHCEFWCENGQWFIKDVQSSSGTFLNHIRLSQPNMESKPFPVNDGDVVQLGIDFRGGEEMIFRCVKIRVELNRAWQKSLNNFNLTTHKRLRDLGKTAPRKGSDSASIHSSECAICLMSIAPCQSLFVAPCSHVWHYKCIRPILNNHQTWPQFLCPNCRAVTDLEADVDEPSNFDFDEDDIENEEDMDVNDSGIPEANDAIVDDLRPSGRLSRQGEDEVLASMANRTLAISHPSTMVQSLTKATSQPTASNSSSLISRRNSRRTSTAPNSNDPSMPRSESVTGLVPVIEGQVRNTTAVQHTSQKGVPSMRATTPSSGELLGADGPMTPTNDAGPFVFDGSAGRAAAPNLDEATENNGTSDA